MPRFELYVAVRRDIFDGVRQPIQWKETGADAGHLLRRYPWPEFAVYPLLLDTKKVRRVKESPDV